MNILKLILASIAFFCLVSCSKHKRLSNNDFKWMPYKGNEVLVFRSNTDISDTIFLLKKDTLTAYPEAQSLFGTTYEIVSIFCKRKDLEYYFVKLGKTIDGKARLDIELRANDAHFYRIFGPKIDSLEKEKPISLRTNFKIYNDVYVIQDEDWMDFKQRSDYVTKIYWSKSEGLIRYDKQDSIYWELVNKYGL